MRVYAFCYSKLQTLSFNIFFLLIKMMMNCTKNYKSKQDHFLAQVNSVLALLAKYPFLEKILCEVDTVGNEKDLFSKTHFNEMKYGFRKLQYRGFRIRSHHGETWYTLRKGVQAVDNAMNIWHIDTV
mgnify:CR=1 FL=1